MTHKNKASYDSTPSCTCSVIQGRPIWVLYATTATHCNILQHAVPQCSRLHHATTNNVYLVHLSKKEAQIVWAYRPVVWMSHVTYGKKSSLQGGEVYTYIFMYIYIHIHIYIYVCMYIYTCIYICTYMYIYINIYIYYWSQNTYIFIYIYICINSRIYNIIYIYIYL